MKIYLQILVLLSCLIVNVASADVLCQRKKEKKPSPTSVLNLKLVKKGPCPAGFTRVGTILTEADVSALISKQIVTSVPNAGPQGVQGIQGEQGPQGEQGAAGIVAIDQCYTNTLSRTGSGEETQKVYCNNPATEYVQHVGYSLSEDRAGPVREILEFTDEDQEGYDHPVGASVRAYIGTTGIGNYTLTVHLLCCPIGSTAGQE